MKCSVTMCNRTSARGGLCRAHYDRKKYHGGVNPDKPIGERSGRFNPHWKGGTFRNADGRVLVKCPGHPYPNHLDGYVFRYRLVMEEAIGRILLPSEIVHHKNEILDDDRIENLEILTRAQHINHHRPQLQAAMKKKRSKLA